MFTNAWKQCKVVIHHRVDVYLVLKINKSLKYSLMLYNNILSKTFILIQKLIQDVCLQQILEFWFFNCMLWFYCTNKQWEVLDNCISLDTKSKRISHLYWPLISNLPKPTQTNPIQPNQSQPNQPNTSLIQH